ncbi:protein kinase domain-containing protein [Parahaliea mediterranea]|uniref:Protein kinase n=1 Tax=Parahaliea mediterranea TaxID=651086 RepID=A0A939DJ67_9GAMM|nr:protein kinase [Parahaliea mediterranea]MBN7799089.1 protein kinase [Parahaliea mediterranea]
MESTWTRTEYLFHAASELPVEERDAYLEKACADDSALLAGVKELLSHAGSDFDPRAAVIATAGDLLSQETDLSGQHLGPYRLKRVLARGGMGVVYLAERADEQFYKQVAIKLIGSPLVGEELPRRFREERQILARLEHAYIARLLDGGSTDQGLPYLVMEYVQGEALDSYCARHALGLNQRLALFQKVCAAVDYAHRQLVVHCDLKDSNIQVTPEGEPRLLDFGIATLMRRSDFGVEPRGPRRMTLRYSSPEQLRGQPLGTATDIYALGVILYGLLSGGPPFDIDEGDPEAYADAVLASDPPAVSVSARRHGLPHWRRLRGDLDAIAARALAKSPEDRYSTAAELSRDIGHHLALKPVTARADTWLYRSATFVRRNRFAAGLASLLLLSILASGGLLAVKSVELAQQRDRANEQRDRALAVTGFLTEMFELGSPYNTLGEEISVTQLLQMASAELDQDGRKTENDRELESHIHRVLGRVNFDLGAFEAARQHLRRSVALLRAAGKTDSERYLLSLLDLARPEDLLDHQDAVLALNTEALALSRRLYGDDHQHTLGTLNNLAQHHAEQGNLRRAEALHLAVYQKRLALFGASNHHTVETAYNLGRLYEQWGKAEQAEHYFDACLRAGQAGRGRRHIYTLRCEGALIDLQARTGRHRQVLASARAHLALMREVMGERHPDTLQAMHTLSLALQRNGRVAESEALLGRTLALRREVLGARHRDSRESAALLAVLRQHPPEGQGGGNSRLRAEHAPRPDR